MQDNTIRRTHEPPPRVRFASRMKAALGIDAPPSAKALKYLSLGKRPGEVYQGTANANAVAKRRAKNKVARRSRAINRKR